MMGLTGDQCGHTRSCFLSASKLQGKYTDSRREDKSLTKHIKKWQELSGTKIRKAKAKWVKPSEGSWRQH